MAKKKCKHLNGTYKEFASIVHERDVETGKIEVGGINEVGNFNRFGFYCSDCKKHFNFYGSSESFPQWFKKYYDESDK